MARQDFSFERVYMTRSEQFEQLSGNKASELTGKSHQTSRPFCSRWETDFAVDYGADRTVRRKRSAHGMCRMFLLLSGLAHA
jgi:hypothetical protein